MSDDSIAGPSSELLDLVRSAEEEAKLKLRKRTPAVPTPVTALPSAGPDVIDVGDEAVDAPPSREDGEAASAPEPVGRRAADPITPGLAPAIALPLVFALAIAALALLAR